MRNMENNVEVITGIVSDEVDKAGDIDEDNN